MKEKIESLARRLSKLMYTEEEIIQILTEELSTLNPNKIDEERFMAIHNSVAPMSAVIQEYNSTASEPLQPLPSEMPSWFTFRGHISDDQLWNEIGKTYGTPTKKELVSVKEPTVIPEPIKAGDKRVLVNGYPLNVDFRILSEDYYQKYFNPPKREWWMDLKKGDKFVYNGEVKILHHINDRAQLHTVGSGFVYVDHCSPYIEPELTAESVIAAHNLTEDEVKAIRGGVK